MRRHFVEGLDYSFNHTTPYAEHMPIVENDLWRMQYFEGIACPDDVIIPTDDQLAYQLYPRHRWVYNKLLICETQGIAHAPHNIPPPSFPVYSKPIYNLRGMGTGGLTIGSMEEYERAQTPGNMWMTHLAGVHVSTDVVLIDGEPRWWRHTLGAPLAHGTFDYWTVTAESRPALEAYCGQWLKRHLKGYTGCINMETIDGRIIEAHLRFADQWPDLYAPGWVEAVVGLYARGRWDYTDSARRTGYSVVLFGRHGVHYGAPDTEALAELRARPGMSSIQITFHADKSPESHAMPAGGFRLAVINCWDLDAGFDARLRIAELFGAAPRLLRVAGEW